ncbi:MAG: hypothetical protein D6744_06125 [Planctomycetota bacterium]|nr:MAG: hypothetical protein D6744_06125 [Planctomycetota bacterium]
MMRAESGGVLRIENVLDNQGGVIEAFDGSLVEIATEANTGGQALRGGTLRTEGTGVVRITDRSRLTDVTNEGAIEQAANIVVKWAGTLTNDGVYTLADDGAHANTVELRSDVTIAGQGELILQRRVFPEHRIQSAFGELWTLTNGVGHTIRGQGLIGAHDLGFVNDGRVVADASGALEIRAHSSMPVVNHGHMVVASGATLRVRDADFTNNTFTTDGDVTIRAGGTFLRTGGNGAEYIQSDGNTVVKGALTVDEFVRLDAGTLSGSGTITTPQLVNAGGSVEPGNSAGVLTVAGDYVQQAGGELRIELGGPQPGSQHDQLVVQGDAALAGALRVLPIDGFVPQLGQSFVILTAGGLSGTFAEVTGPGAWSVDYSNARVTITVQQTPDPGLDGDCDVDLGDLALLLADFGCSGDGCPGDLDGDGDTDFTDLAVLLANFGALCP